MALKRPSRRGELTTLRRIVAELLCATIGHRWTDHGPFISTRVIPGTMLPIANVHSYNTWSCQRCRVCCDVTRDPATDVII